jgi:hypothetical protein
MSNLSGIDDNSTFSSSLIPTLDELLDSLGFGQWSTVTFSFVLPSINFLGIIFCSLSAYIFFQRKFVDPIFFYYRLLCLSNVFHLTLGIPYGVLFAPRYFPQVDTYFSTIYLMFYVYTSLLLFHFEDVIQMAILLTRMKIFSPFVNKYFKLLKPKLVSLIFFLVCLCINLPNFFALTITSNGTYSYYDQNSKQKKVSTFYSVVSSEFSLSPMGKILYGLTAFFLNLFLTLVVGLILNVLSVYQYKSYLKERKKRDEAYVSAAFSHNKRPIETQPTTSLDAVVSVVVVVAATTKEMTQKERNDRKAESNMFLMALTLSTISTISRVLALFTYIYNFLLYTTETTLIVPLIFYLIQSFGPTSSIFVFYFFNKKFRQEFIRKPSRLKCKVVLNISSLKCAFC